MKKSIIFIIILFMIEFTSVFGELVDITYVKTTNEIVVIATFTKPPKVQYYSKNGSKTVHFFVINDTLVSPIFLPISAESVEGVQIIPFKDTMNLFVYTLTPINANYSVTGSKLYIRLPMSFSSRRLTANFVNLKSEFVLRDIADFFGINLVVYNGAMGKVINSRANNSTLEQILRGILTLSGLSYAYSEDQTLYIGTPEEIERTFLLSFQISAEKVSSEEMSKMFIESIYSLPSSDKSKLFTYGGTKEYRTIASAIGLAASMVAKKIDPKPKWEYVNFIADFNDVQNLLQNLKKIYDFDFVILPELKKVALSGADIEKVKNFLLALQPLQKPKLEEQYKIISSEYPQRVANFLKSLYTNINVQVFGDKVYVPVEFENIAKALIQDPVISKPWKMTFSEITEDIVKTALDYLDVTQEYYILKSYEDSVYVTLFVSEKKFGEFLNIVNSIGTTTMSIKADDELLKKFKVDVIESFADGSKLVRGKIKEIEKLKKAVQENLDTVVIKAEPLDPTKDVISKLTGYTVEFSDGYWIFTVPKQDITKIQEKMEDIRDKYGKNLIVLSDQYDEKAIELVKKLYNVEIYLLSDKTVIYGALAQSAKEFMERFSREDSIIYEIQTIDANLKTMLEDNFGVKVYSFDNFAYIVGKRENVEKARLYVKSTETMIVSVDFVLTSSHIDYIKNVFKVDTTYFENLNKIRISGTIENVLRAAAYLKSLASTIELKSVKSSNNLNKDDLEKIAKFIEISVVIEQVGDVLYLKGTKEEIARLNEEIDKLSQIPELNYEIVSYDDSVDSIMKELYKVETYKTKAGYVVYGTQEQINKVKELAKVFVEGKKIYELISYPE
ncbi:hypothetical protein, partial [Fervidobacterium sp.]